MATIDSGKSSNFKAKENKIIFLDYKFCCLVSNIKYRLYISMKINNILCWHGIFLKSGLEIFYMQIS